MSNNEFVSKIILHVFHEATQRERQPLARVKDESLANPNLCDEGSPEFRARSASRLDAVLGGLVIG
jgi:hypothetical protein